ncbi:MULTISPECIES: Hint domain-containing protein [Asaia]|uniref:Hint domain-containing protein n=1 Tax=Asaia TaxID=91914 RepID=UPI002FC3CFB9
MAADPHTATQRYTQVALNGEVWSAVNVSGVTRYQSGAVVVDGPIVLGGATTLIVTAGATASGVLGAGTGGSPTVVVMSGGTLTNSTINRGSVTVSSGGVTSGNAFSGDSVMLAAGGSSVADDYYATGGATGVVSALAGAQMTNVTFTSGMTLSALAGATLSDIKADASAVVLSGGKAVNFTTSNITISDSVVTSHGVATGALITGGVWNAVNSGGVTYYQSGSVSISGPVFFDNGTLNVTSGAVVDGLLQGQNGNPTVNVLAGGKLINSTLNNGYLVVQSGGYTSGNNGNSEQTTISAGGSSVNDNFYTNYGGNDSVTVLSGGSITGVNVSNTTLTVSSGATLGSFHNLSGGTIQIQPGANVGSATTITSNPATADQRYKQVTLGGEVWSAVNVGGQTVYQSGTVTVSGPIVMGETSTLVITSGATVSGLLAGAAGGTPTITVMNGGKLINSTVNWGNLTVAAGGYTSGNAFNADKATYASGAQSINDDFYATNGHAAVISAAAGATLTGSTVTSGMTLSALTGSLLTGIKADQLGVVMSGNKQVNFTTSNITIDSGVVTSHSLSTGAYLTGGIWSAVNSGGVTYYQSGSVSISGPVYLENATLNVMSGAVVDGLLAGRTGYPVVNVMAGGVLQNSTLNNGYLNVASGGVTSNNYGNSEATTISSGGKSVNDTFYTTYNGNDSVTVLGGGSISGVNLSNTTLTVSSGATLVPPLNLGSGATVTIYGAADVCFLAGTMIRTAEGETPVEDIRIGDEILTFDPQTQEAVLRCVTWVGEKEKTVGHSLSANLADYPVRILRNALAENMPHKDLLVTAEHCLYLGGGFVPVRMLVNGRTIFIDTSITTYHYYHIETEHHAVIWADGALTESYLDTGNARTFAQPGAVKRLPGQAKTWEQDAAAPLLVARDAVEPLFNDLLARAIHLGTESRVATPEMTMDADLHLMTEKGKIIRKLRENKDQVTFMIPPGTQSVRLCSRASRPCDAIGPYVDDRRLLGVLVGSITLFDATETVELTRHLSGEALDGWLGSDACPCRWTNGNALLELDLGARDTVSMLAIQIVEGGPYLVDADARDQEMSLSA